MNKTLYVARRALVNAALLYSGGLASVMRGGDIPFRVGEGLDRAALAYAGAYLRAEGLKKAKAARVTPNGLVPAPTRGRTRTSPVAKKSGRSGKN